MFRNISKIITSYAIGSVKTMNFKNVEVQTVIKNDAKFV